jgi:hypothetical protein
METTAQDWEVFVFLSDYLRGISAIESNIAWTPYKPDFDRRALKSGQARYGFAESGPVIVECGTADVKPPVAPIQLGQKKEKGWNIT